MRADAVADLAGQAAVVRIDRCDFYGDARVIDRTRIELRGHEGEVVVLALELERCAVLPAVPNRAQGENVFAQPRSGRGPLH